MSAITSGSPSSVNAITYGRPSPRTRAAPHAIAATPQTDSVHHDFGLQAWRRASPSGVRRAGVAQRPRCRQLLAGLQQGLEAGEDHRPTTVDLAVHARLELVVDDGQAARVLADRLDRPGHPVGPRVP